MATILILCGGEGKRLRPLTDNIPKPMIEVAGRPMLQHQVEQFRNAGFTNFIFCTGYKHEVIEKFFGDGAKFGVKIRYSEEKEPLGTSGAIKLAAKGVKETVFVVNGDCMHDADPAKILKFHEDVKKKNPKLEATDFLVQFRSPYGIAKMNGDLIREFQEKPLLNEWLNAGIYVLEQSLMPKLPSKGAIETLIFPGLAKEGRIAGYKHTGKWRDVGTLKDLEEAQKEFK
jgi:glucose-1-phosphate thymidylyltransferase